MMVQPLTGVILATAIILALLALLVVIFIYARALMNLRIRVFRRLNWNWAADLIENHFETWILVLRVVIVCVAFVFTLLGVTQLP